MSYSRHIDVESNLVFHVRDISVTMDCSWLAEQSIVYVAEERGLIWVERNPFNGREVDFDFTPVIKMFEDAELQYNEEMRIAQEVHNELMDIITTVQLVTAVTEMQLEMRYQLWTTSEERTLLEKTELQHTGHWHRKNPLLKKLFDGMGLTERQATNLFELAKSVPV